METTLEQDIFWLKEQLARYRAQLDKEEGRA